MVYFTYLIYVFTFNLILKNLKCNNDHTTYQKTMIILTLVGVIGPIIYIYIYIYMYWVVGPVRGHLVFRR